MEVKNEIFPLVFPSENIPAEAVVFPLIEEPCPFKVIHGYILEGNIQVITPAFLEEKQLSKSDLLALSDSNWKVKFGALNWQKLEEHYGFQPLLGAEVKTEYTHLGVLRSTSILRLMHLHFSADTYFVSFPTMKRVILSDNLEDIKWRTSQGFQQSEDAFLPSVFQIDGGKVSAVIFNYVDRSEFENKMLGTVINHIKAIMKVSYAVSLKQIPNMALIKKQKFVEHVRGQIGSDYYSLTCREIVNSNFDLITDTDPKYEKVPLDFLWFSIREIQTQIQDRKAMSDMMYHLIILMSLLGENEQSGFSAEFKTLIDDLTEIYVLASNQ